MSRARGFKESYCGTLVRVVESEVFNGLAKEVQSQIENLGLFLKEFGLSP